MSTTRSQKRKNFQQENVENISRSLVSPVVGEDPSFPEQDVSCVGPSQPKSPRIENSLLESLRASLKEESTSEIKYLLIESQKEMVKLLKPETRENIRENVEEGMENETRSFHTPTRSVRINSTQNDLDISRKRLPHLREVERRRHWKAQPHQKRNSRRYDIISCTRYISQRRNSGRG